MKKLSLVRVLVVFSLCSKAAQALNPDLCDHDPRPHPRIIGGDVAIPGEFPFIVNIQTPEQFYCGGSIYNERTIVTAAHCVYDKDDKVTLREKHGDTLIVVAGDHNVASNVSEASEQTMEIETEFYHEDYVSMKVDIGIYILKKPIRFSSRVHPVMIGTWEDSQVLPRLTLAGWGIPVSSIYTIDGSIPVPPTSCLLKKLIVPVYPNEYCRQMPVGELCIGEPEDSMCQGDSGGPLVFQDEAGCTKQIGVVSRGDAPCGTMELSDGTGTLMNAPFYLKWIEEHAVGPRKHDCQTKYPKFDV